VIRFRVESLGGLVHVTTETVQIISGILALLCVAAIILRRKAKKKKVQEDEF
jgi:hypothetical protein